MITPQNIRLFVGALMMFVGLIFAIIGVATGLSGTPGRGDPVLPLIFGIVGGVLVVAGGALVFNALARRRLDDELRRTGMPVEATVTEVAPSHVKINRVRLWAVHYQYQDAFGTAHRDKYLINPDDAPQWQAGQKVTVRYDAQRPYLHVWIGPPL